MKRLLVTLLFLLGCSAVASARDSAQGWCEEGNRPVIVSGLTSTTRVQASHPSCTVTVYIHGAGLATIYADNNSTPLANPFTSRTDGQWQFYADDGRYDVTMSSAGFSQTITYSDILLCDPFAAGAVCAGATANAHNLLSTTHLDTIPFSPPARGDVITAQNQTSPSGVTPAWARLAIGTNGQVLGSNGVDVLWVTPAAGGGCTLSGVSTGVVSEFPVGTCHDSLNWTWDDGSLKQNMMIGDGSSAITTNTRLAFLIGDTNQTQTGLSGTMTDVFAMGNNNTLIAASGARNNFYFIGRQNFANNTGSRVVLIGDTNSVQDLNDPGGQHTQIYSFGRNNSVVSSSAGTGANISDGVLIGESNAVTASPAVSGLGSFRMDGFSNQITLSGSGSYFSIGLYGESNVLTGTVNGIQRTHILGNANTVEDTLALSDQIVIAGDSNDVNGSISTVQILGYKNIAHNVSAQVSTTVNTTLVGSAISATNTGATGSPAYQGAFGATLTLSNCTGCWIVGQGVTNSTSNTLAIGMSATPEIVITSGNVTYRATLFASLGTPTNGTLTYCSDCTIANPCASGGTGAFAKRLNSIWVCN